MPAWVKVGSASCAFALPFHLYRLVATLLGKLQAKGIDRGFIQLIWCLIMWEKTAVSSDCCYTTDHASLVLIAMAGVTAV